MEEIMKRNVGALEIKMGVQALLEWKGVVQEIQEKVMTEGIDFGIIPGCSKPTLLKPGAELLNLTFGLRPILDPAKDIIRTDLPGNHKDFEVTIHILNSAGLEIATGVGSCSTMESKYRYRNAQHKCPNCGQATIFKSKNEGEGFFCWQKKGGCGYKFKPDDEKITKQEVGRVENEDPADLWNTVLKIAKKRALIDGDLNATAASHVFTQDVEDMNKEIIRDAEYREIKVEKPVEKKEEMGPNDLRRADPGFDRFSSDGTEGRKQVASSDDETVNEILDGTKNLTEKKKEKAVEKKEEKLAKKKEEKQPELMKEKPVDKKAVLGNVSVKHPEEICTKEQVKAIKALMKFKGTEEELEKIVLETYFPMNGVVQGFSSLPYELAGWIISLLQESGKSEKK